MVGLALSLFCMSALARNGLLCTPLVILLFVAGCGGFVAVCTFGTINVSPAVAIASPTAIAPSNSQQFLAFGSEVPSGCVIATSNLANVVWSVSDPSAVSISNAPGQTFGVATCLAPTAAPVTITATLPAGLNNGQSARGTATLTCK